MPVKCGHFKKASEKQYFSWLSSQKENWKKRTWIKCIFCWNTSELVFSQLSSRSVFMITPCAKILSLFDICLWYLVFHDRSLYKKIKFVWYLSLIFVFDIGIDHPLCKKMGLSDIWYYAVMYINLIFMIICCSLKRRRACFPNRLNMNIVLLIRNFISEIKGSLVPDSCL